VPDPGADRDRLGDNFPSRPIGVLRLPARSAADIPAHIVGEAMSKTNGLIPSRNASNTEILQSSTAQPYSVGEWVGRKTD
jgi:hypothetical protein